MLNTLLNSGEDRGVLNWIITIVALLLLSAITLTMVLRAINKTIELLVKLLGAYKSSGLPMMLNVDNKLKIKRRKQFCNVMISDLGQLSRAENWNDQNFTDLEAEVEIEGGYFANPWDRLRRKKSYGLRKEPSLVRAITSSAERALQLIGEPGSGKSVALRHLAMEFAERGRKSNDGGSIVPLYINLREMEAASSSGISADDVRKFVLENIRRGDADTLSYVRENWNDYCSRGIWLFLFDSFDEIPAVLHSPAGSASVKQYSEAIRMFLDGMGECKGVLASREFKGPEALPWNKLRILPLSGEKQDELIDNSLLPETSLKLVRQHLANSHSSTGSTPLFLTLLCRFVRDEQRAPNNDHDILLRHIDRLAKREPDHLLRRYRFTVDELIQGAERLARLFAENERLSLAPTLDQIKAQLPDEEIPTGSVERLVLALVDCKIGRADVPNAANGDRRFAFAHRRYQEALFVKYLAKTPAAISSEDLLTDPRWREYAVTLLQTCEVSEIQNLLTTGQKILETRSSLQSVAREATHPLPAKVGFFDWDEELAVPLLTLLQEGMSRRLSDVPLGLSEAVCRFLEPRWAAGDTQDRCEVLRLGGLLPPSILLSYLSLTFRNGTAAERAHAFRLATFTPSLPVEIQEQVLEALSDEVIEAKTRADQLSIEALAARLPAAVGAHFVVERGNKIRRRFRLVSRVVSTLLSIIPKRVLDRSKSFIRIRKDSVNRAGKSGVSPVLVTFLPLVMVGFLLFTKLLELSGESDIQRWITVCLLSVAFAMLASICFPYMVRGYGKKVGFVDLLKLARKYSDVNTALVIGKIAAAFIFFMASTVPFGYLVEWASRTILQMPLVSDRGYTYPNMMGIGLIATLLLMYGFGFVLMVRGILKSRKNTRRWTRNLEAVRQKKLSDLDVVYSASDVDELLFWLKYDKQLLNGSEFLRGFSSLTLHKLRLLTEESPQRSGQEIILFPLCLMGEAVNIYKVNSIRQALEPRYRRRH
nr:NACHT domain-containing protein [Pseudomonas savastanoi]